MTMTDEITPEFVPAMRVLTRDGLVIRSRVKWIGAISPRLVNWIIRRNRR